MEFQPAKKARVEDDVASIAQEVHAALGYGLNEAIYRNAMEVEAQLRGYRTHREHVIPIRYKGTYVGCGKADLVLEKDATSTVIELKSVLKISPQHCNQLSNYLMLSGVEHGAVVNFGPEGVTVKDVMRPTTIKHER